jgi:MYXO-CTERM domain-containing protein
VHATIADMTVDEGNDGVSVVPITITFDRPAPDGSKVQVSTVGAGAIADQDFRGFSQTLYPLAGATQMTFNLEVLSDTVPECDEGLYIRYNTVSMGDDSAKLAKVILRNDDGAAQGCSDPFVRSPPPDPPIDGGGPAAPVEPGPIDGGGAGVGLDVGSPPSTPAEPHASDAGVVTGPPDTGGGAPGSTGDAQRVPDVQAPSSIGDSGHAKPGDETPATQSGCSCALDQGARSARFPWLALIGLLAALPRCRRRSRRWRSRCSK